MLKQLVLRIALASLMLISLSANANTGNLFNISTTGASADVNITVCLNGLSPLSCQNYTLSALDVTISPNIPNHVYPSIGIKINTPGYTLDGCSPSPDGYCLFSASQSEPKTFHLVTNSSIILSSSTNPSVYNQSVLFTANILPNTATGTVNFTDNGTVIGSGTLSHGIATYTTSLFTTGTHTIIAIYAGNNNFNSSTSNAVNQVVNKANQVITFQSTAPSATAGGATYTPIATSTSDLMVAITVDASSSNVCSISNGIVSFIAAGTCTLNANQAGNLNYNAAAQVQQAVTVYAPTPTTTVLYSSSNPSTVGASITLSANVTSSNGTPTTGTVSFTANGSSISGCATQSLTTGIATCTTSFSAGTRTIVATYTGGSGFAASTSGTFSQSVITGANLSAIRTVPAAPQYVTAIPGNGQVTVKWYPPANTGGSAIIGYTVKYGTTASATYTNSGCTTTSGLSCVVNNLTNGTPYTFTVVAINAQGSGLTAYSSSVAPEATLTASPSNLALSGLGGGAARTTTITNHSGSDVTIASVNADFPSGTTVNTDQANACALGTVLTAGGGFCTITIIPGANPACTAGTVPTPSVITVTDNNGDTTTVNVVILGYGCQYQEGYLFAIDDTTPLTSSISGKVVTLSDQSSGTVRWSTQLTAIWGINDASTIANPSPRTPTATLATGQLNCNAVNDGTCATNNVFIHYGVDLSVDYAAELCKATINGYTDWYLPSVCDLGPFGSTGINTGNYPNISSSSQACSGSTNIQDQLARENIVTNFNEIDYWSSTEVSGTPSKAWIQHLASSGGGSQSTDAKNSNGVAGARCTRGLTL